MQIKVAAAILVRDFRFSVHPSTKIPLEISKTNGMLIPHGNVWMTAQKI